MAMQKTGKRLPVTVQVTLEATGTMLLGTEIGAALTALEPFDVDVIGLNCATGPKEMNDAVRFLGLNSSKLISILPNAGLPQNEGGHAVYKLSPAELAQYHKRFVTEYGVSIVGGCCGTTPEHLKAVVNAVANAQPARREVKPTAAASSAYTSVPLDLDPKPLVVAEEMNTTTRVEHFRNLVRGKKYDRTCSTCVAPSSAKMKRVTSRPFWKGSPPVCRRRSWSIRQKPTWSKRR